ncbi:MAG: HAD family hydrolase [Sulfitobacter sp.]
MWTPDLVIFDCDGVLVDSEPLTLRALCDDLAGRGLALGAAEAAALFVGGTMQGVMQIARDRGADLPHDWIDLVDAKIFAVLEAECLPVPGIEAVLDALAAAGIPVAVASNGPMAKMEVTLGRTGLRQRLGGHVYSAHDCAAPKPAPDVYLKAASRAGIDPARCAVIEDSASGARAGQAAGMRVFGFAADTPAQKLAPHADQVFYEMKELPGLLGL